MKKIDIKTLRSNDEFFEATFQNIHLAKQLLQNKTFEACKFNSCDFTETNFERCTFIDCDFDSCNLSLIQLNSTSFVDTVFSKCKLVGLNWNTVNWPYIKLTSPIQFYESDISHSSFFGLELKELICEGCTVHDVDFREADLTGSNFMHSDLEKSQFMKTKLYAADFTDATNYYIDPNKNNIRKGKFSMPDVINLLASFDIEVQN